MQFLYFRFSGFGSRTGESPRDASCSEAVDEAGAAVEAALGRQAGGDLGGAASEEAAGREDAAAAGEAALAEAAPVNEGHAVLAQDLAGDGLLQGQGHGRDAGDGKSEHEQDLHVELNQ